MQLHVVCATTDGGLIYGVRSAGKDGNWLSAGSVTSEAQRFEKPPISLSCVGNSATTTVEVCAVSSDGHLLSSSATEPFVLWTSLEDVNNLLAKPHVFTSIGTGSLFGQLAVCTISTEGPWYLLREASSHWHTVDGIADPDGTRFPAVRVSSATDENTGVVHLCGITNTGHVMHTSRQNQGSSWYYSDDFTLGQPPASFEAVSCAVLPGSLYVIARTIEGTIQHLFRDATGHWSPFSDITSVSGFPGRCKDITCARVGEELHLLAIDGDNHLWHAIRFPNDSWCHFTDVGLHLSANNNIFTLISATGGKSV